MVISHQSGRRSGTSPEPRELEEQLATIRGQHEAELARRDRELEALLALASRTSLRHDEATIAAAAIEACLDLTGSRFGFLALCDPSGVIRIGTLRARHHSDETTLLARVEASAVRVLCETVLDERVPLCWRTTNDQRPTTNDHQLPVHEARSTAPERSDASPLESFLGVPLLFGDELIGAICLCDREGGYGDAERTLGLRFANQAAIALQNARMVSQISVALETRRRQLENLSHAAQELSVARDERAALQQVVKAINTAFDARSTWVMLCDESAGEYSTWMFWRDGPIRFLQLSQPWNQGAIRPVLQRNARVFLRDVRAEEDFPFRDEVVTAGVDAMLAVPLIAHDRTLGALAIFTDAYVPRVAADWEFVCAFAAQVAGAIENARRHAENAQLLAEARSRKMELEILWSIGQEVSTNLEPETVLQRIAEGARRLVGADAASVVLYDERRSVLRFAAWDGLEPETTSQPIPIDRGVPRALALEGAPQETPKLRGDPIAQLVPGLSAFASMLSVPLLDGSDVVGSVNVYARAERAFAISEVKILSTLATFATVAHRNARVFQRDSRIARRFQDSLLPELPVQIEGVEIAHEYLAALRAEADVGGDLYDVFPLGDGQVGLVIGDISGKGLGAAVQSQRVRTSLRAFATESTDPAEVIRRLNATLARDADPEWFASLFFGVFDPRTGNLAYANAGHERPLILRSHSGEAEQLTTTGPALGILDTVQYRRGHASIAPEDTLVLYTDGFTEARRGQEFLQVEGFSRMIREASDRAPGDLVTDVCRRVREFTSGEQRDDATILVVRSSPRATTASSPSSPTGGRRRRRTAGRHSPGP
jgi:GAF domain-containing protein